MEHHAAGVGEPEAVEGGGVAEDGAAEPLGETLVWGAVDPASEVEPHAERARSVAAARTDGIAIRRAAVSAVEGRDIAEPS